MASLDLTDDMWRMGSKYMMEEFVWDVVMLIDIGLQYLREIISGKPFCPGSYCVQGRSTSCTCSRLPSPLCSELLYFDLKNIARHY